MPVAEKTIYSVDGGERTLELHLAGHKIGNLLKMPDFSVDAVYDDQVVGKFIQGVTKTITQAIDAIGQMVLETDSDLGNTTWKGLDGVQETLKAYMQMQGISFMSNGVFTRKFFEHASHQRYSFSVRANTANLNALLTIKEAYLPRPLKANVGEDLINGILDIMRPSAWIGDKKDGTDYGRQSLDKLQDNAMASVNEGIITLKGTDGTDVNKIAGELKAISDKQNKEIDKRLDNVLGINDETKELAQKSFIWTEGVDNLDIASAKVKVAGKNFVIDADKLETDVIRKIAEIVGQFGALTSVLAPKQLTVNDVAIIYGGKNGGDVTDKIIRKASTNGGVIYPHQHLVIDSISVNPSEALMTSKNNVMVPLYYDIDISMSTTMTPIA